MADEFMVVSLFDESTVALFCELAVVVMVASWRIGGTMAADRVGVMFGSSTDSAGDTMLCVDRVDCGRRDVFSRSCAARALLASDSALPARCVRTCIRYESKIAVMCFWPFWSEIE